MNETRLSTIALIERFLEGSAGGRRGACAGCCPEFCMQGGKRLTHSGGRPAPAFLPDGLSNTEVKDKVTWKRLLI